MELITILNRCHRFQGFVYLKARFSAGNKSSKVAVRTAQRLRLRDLLHYNLKTVRAYLLKEACQQLWDYNSPAWAGKFPR